MIEATCTACGRLLGSFPDMEKYYTWRNKNTKCECGAPLDTTLYTTEKEKPKAKAEEPKAEATKQQAKEKSKRRLKLWR